MIVINKSKTADSRTTDRMVSEAELFHSSLQHILDVKVALEFCREKLYEIGEMHDRTKLTYSNEFHNDFRRAYEKEEGFDFKTNSSWFQKHITEERHHLTDAVPENVNLFDVLERICDIVMAGMGRSGEVTFETLDGSLLQEAYLNTMKLLAENVVVNPDE